MGRQWVREQVAVAALAVGRVGYFPQEDNPVTVLPLCPCAPMLPVSATWAA